MDLPLLIDLLEFVCEVMMCVLCFSALRIKVLRGPTILMLASFLLGLLERLPEISPNLYTVGGVSLCPKTALDALAKWLSSVSLCSSVFYLAAVIWLVVIASAALKQAQGRQTGV